MSEFIVKHYADYPHPTIKGNGFDGLVIGDYREEAQRFVDYVNKIQKENEEFKKSISSILETWDEDEGFYMDSDDIFKALKNLVEPPQSEGE